jgi:hypothetical protein
MKNSSTFRVPGSKIILVVLLSLAMSECGSDVNFTFNLINPCRTNVLGDEECQFIRLVVSSLSAGDDLYPGNNPGPLARECTIDKGNCGVSSSELLGSGRIVDIQCYLDRGSPPVARATSEALVVDENSGGSFNLVIGNINGFVETTYLKGPDTGDCSLMAQGGGRFGHTATRLDDGRILIVGGIRRITTVQEILDTAEIFDPKTGEHRQIVGPEGRTQVLNAGRAFHTATKLRDGNVLITGGIGTIDNKWSSLRSSEIFEFKSETFPEGSAWIGILETGRANHTATMLTTSGKVLVVGGTLYNDGNLVGYSDSAEVYDPSRNEWTTAINAMASARAFHTATELDPNDLGKVLITGGSDASGPLKSIEIYNPDDNQFYSNVDPLMAVNRAHHCAVRLENGDVMVAGGTTTGDYQDVNAGVEIYTTKQGGQFGCFRPQMVLNLTNARMDHTCALLEGTGDVLVAGGLTGSGLATGSGEVVVVGPGPADYQVNALTDPMDPARYLQAAAALGNGWVYLCGGLPSQAEDAQGISQSLLFVPETPYQ